MVLKLKGVIHNVDDTVVKYNHYLKWYRLGESMVLKMCGIHHMVIVNNSDFSTCFGFGYPCFLFL